MSIPHRTKGSSRENGCQTRQPKAGAESEHPSFGTRQSSGFAYRQKPPVKLQALSRDIYQYMA